VNRLSSRAAKSLHAEHVDARGCQFERKRYAVEPVANLDDRSDILVAQGEPVHDRQGALIEQLDGGILQHRDGCQIVGARRQFKRGETVQPFTLGPQRLPAGGQNRDTRRRLEDRFGDCRHRAEHVLATVEHDQRTFVPEPSRQSRYRVDARQRNSKHGA
jgi:hypothetical protein